MAKVDYVQLKNTGFMQQNLKDHFSLRIRVVGGHVKSEHLKVINEVAEQFGRGYVHMTSRQSIEVPFIALKDIETIRTILAEAGVETAACGAQVRTITACQGNAVCSGGLLDTLELANDLDKHFGGRPLPHKFKIGITGCRNNCLKAEENDLGIKGAMKVTWHSDLCTYCGACQTICKGKAIQVNKKEKTLHFEEADCVMCGKCVKICKKSAWSGQQGLRVYFGGLFGNRITIGKQLIPVVYNREDLYKAIEVALAFFNKHGKSKERFATTLDRVGWDLLQKDLEEAKLWTI